MTDVFISPENEYYIEKDGVPFALGRFNENAFNKGNVYVCKAREQLSKIGATFVDIGDDRTAFLPDLKHKTGSVFVVQIKAEAHDGKGAEVTENISFSGKYAVVTFIKDAENKLEFSKKIQSGDVRNAIKNQLVIPEIAGFGITVKVRTAFDIEHISDLKTEIDSKVNLFRKLISSGKTNVEALYKISLADYLNVKYRVGFTYNIHFGKPLDFYSEYINAKSYI